MCRHPNGQVRAGAALVLIRLSTNRCEAIYALQRVLAEKQDGVGKALEAMKELGASGREAEALVLGFLGDGDRNIRFQAIDALGAIAGTAGIAALIKTMNDEDKAIRAQAADALGDVGPRATEAVPALSHAVAVSDHLLVRESAIEALGKIGSGARSAVPILLTILSNRDESTDLRCATAMALSGIAPRDPRVIGALTAGLEDAPELSDTDVCAAIAAALGKAGSAAQRAVPILTNVLNDANAAEEVRASAARSLTRIGVASKEVLSALSAVLSDEGWYVSSEDLRREAARTLGELRAASALQILKHVLADNEQEESVRKAAARAIRLIASEDNPHLHAENKVWNVPPASPPQRFCRQRSLLRCRRTGICHGPRCTATYARLRSIARR